MYENAFRKWHHSVDRAGVQSRARSFEPVEIGTKTGK